MVKNSQSFLLYHFLLFIIFHHFFAFNHFVIISLIVNHIIHWENFHWFLRAFWCVPWLEFYLSDDPCLGNFEKNYIYFVGSRRVQKIWIFSNKETWPHIISNHYCFIFKKVNPETRFNASQHTFFIFFIFFHHFLIYFYLLYCPFFCLDCLHRFSI